MHKLKSILLKALLEFFLVLDRNTLAHIVPLGSQIFLDFPLCLYPDLCWRLRASGKVDMVSSPVSEAC